MEWHCPICQKPVDSAQSPDFPFCSERCRLLDLGNWASEKYKISEPVIDESTPEAPGKQRDEDERKN
ncbi:MAG TPA: DNA gyrase inhibitor YacG [Candidatus Acidoferrales bacterium]|nr:DNA gyrase inhibitor YacG [Candidatus Acidoferrales bacterium]